MTFVSKACTKSISPQHVIMAMADTQLDREKRHDLAMTLARFLPSWGGEQFDVEEVDRPMPDFVTKDRHWEQGTPPLASFVTLKSFQLFRAIGQQPGDLDWLEVPVEDWESYPTYVDFATYVNKKAVVNDAAERCVENNEIKL